VAVIGGAMVIAPLLGPNMALAKVTKTARFQGACPRSELTCVEKATLALLGNAERLDIIRQRLGSVSWFRRALNAPIARMANREDGCRGRFRECRFKCQALHDEQAVMSCMADVDRNPLPRGNAKKSNAKMEIEGAIQPAPATRISASNNT
jgi:hypothetical protein